jgi:hypothetical protein
MFGGAESRDREIFAQCTINNRRKNFGQVIGRLHRPYLSVRSSFPNEEQHHNRSGRNGVIECSKKYLCACSACLKGISEPKD